MVQQAGLLALQGGVVLDDTGAPLLELVSENANNLYINYNKIGQHFLRLKIHWNWRREIYYSQWECSTVVLSIYLMILNREAGKVLANENVAYSLANVNELRWRITKTNIVDMFAILSLAALVNELRWRITKTNIADMFAILFVGGFSERTSSPADISGHSLANKRGELREYVRCFTAETFC